jgi:S1-C subfamily serine protease
MDHVVVTGFPNFKIGDSGVIMPGLVVGFRPVSGVRRILTNALIIAGNSGGPVFDTGHRVIGIAVTGADRMEEAIETENYGIIPVDAINYL